MATYREGVGPAVHVIYRLAPTRKSEVRPDWFSQLACLRSFIASAEVARSAGVHLRSTVITDGDVAPEILAELGWFDSQEQIHLLGNSPAFRYALEVALLSHETIVLFAEDDYMWTRDAVFATVALIDSGPTDCYASPYAHPVVDDTSTRETRRHRISHTSLSGVEWRSTPRTTMTFACQTSTLQKGRHYWRLATYGRSPKDSYAFRALLDGKWFELVGNAAFRDPRRVMNLETIRLIAQCVVRRLDRSRRPRLYQPVEGLATHVHLPFITGPTDWESMAVALVTESA